MAFLVLILAAIVALTTACGGNDTGSGSPSTSADLTPDPTTYTAPPTEKTGQTGGEKTGTATGGGTVIRIGGPNVENRNRSTAWPTIHMASGGRTAGYGCTERYNVNATIPVTIKDVQIASPFGIVQEWEICKEYAQGNRGCKGRTLPPEPNVNDAKSPGCAMVIKVGKFTGKERTADLRFTFEARCTAAKGTPCDKVPAGKLPATVTWTASEKVTAIYPDVPDQVETSPSS